MKKNLQSALLLSLSVLLFAIAYWRAENRVIRMHVIAQSDSEEDQQVKLLVRCALLPGINAALKGTAAPVESLRTLLPAIERQAEALAHVPVTATLSKESYPARFDSGSFLPAGRYTALRITLGEGHGHNWWGVVYPNGDEEDAELRSWLWEKLRQLL